VLSYGCRRLATVVFACVLSFAPAVHAQTVTTLTLADAISLARRNNPDYLQQQNDMTVADWTVRGAYGSLMPNASVSTSYSYTAAGAQRFGNFTGSDLGLATSTDYYSSSYGLNLGYRVSASSLMAPGQAKSQRRATAANIESAEWNLNTNVTRQYIALKRAVDGVILAKREVSRAEENLRLAQARVNVGAAIPLEAKSAEVERGRTEVALVQAENAVNIERLRLSQLLAVDLPADVQLTTVFPLTDVTWTEAQLIELATSTHPALQAARAAEESSLASVKMARSAYLPSLNLSAGISGFARQAGNSQFLVDQARSQAQSSAAQCLQMNAISAGLSTPLPGFPKNCSFNITPDQEASIRSSNSQFPFGYETDPFSMSLSISLPLFDGLQREQQVEQARVGRADAALRLKSEELRIRADIGTALNNARSFHRSAQLEARNAALADEQLTAARQRYQVGQTSFIELQEAETQKARADRAYLTSLYQFHESVAALEAAVGRPLTTGTR
jgi:outer membrane protein